MDLCLGTKASVPFACNVLGTNLECIGNDVCINFLLMVHSVPTHSLVPIQRSVVPTFRGLPLESRQSPRDNARCTKFLPDSSQIFAPR
mmetsp:Transcript_23377/g.40253  ORF Transcript_23377/g.40253 Transcript_23377/m.40253 type:complete len:88 (-) Transcript_23377:112-375(-)